LRFTTLKENLIIRSLVVLLPWVTSAIFVISALYLHRDYLTVSFLFLFFAILLPLTMSQLVLQRQLKRLTRQVELNDLALEVVKADLQGVNKDLQGVNKDLQGVNKDLQGVNKDLQGVNKEVSGLRRDIKKDMKALSLAKSVETHDVASSISHLVMDIRPTKALNFTRSWMATPQFLLALYEEIKGNKPQTVLDIGSGMTTVMSAFALRANGFGKVYAWEHELGHAQNTRELIESHNLSHFTQVEHRLLKSVELSGTDFLWFDTSNSFEKQIDLLIVDSPPGSTGPMARYPAIPLLKHRLSENAIIFVDDVERADESKMVKEWLKLLPNSKVSISKPQEKGQFAVIRCGTLEENRDNYV
jgi:predicted O-methyltransferase YrrM